MYMHTCIYMYMYIYIWIYPCLCMACDAPPAGGEEQRRVSLLISI